MRFYLKYHNVKQNVPKCARHIKKNIKKDPKQLGIKTNYIQSSSTSHKSIGLSSTVPGAPGFG